jgi:hypothetical protein
MRGCVVEGPATFDETVMAWEKFSGEKANFELPWTKGNEPDWIKTILTLTQEEIRPTRCDSSQRHACSFEARACRGH